MIQCKDPDRFKVDHEETVRRWEAVVREIRNSVESPLDPSEAARRMHPAIHEVIDLQSREVIDPQSREDTDLEIRGEMLYVLVTAIEALMGRWVAEGQEYEVATDKQISINRELMRTKNQAYGSSWSIMRPAGLVDSIHTKIHRIESLLAGADNKYESVVDSFEDILNYAVFTCMRIDLDTEERRS